MAISAKMTVSDVESTPARRPPYHALMSTAMKNSSSGSRSRYGSSNREETKATRLVATARA